jgi:CRISPR/Cas system CSM-associated protein Csm2 small subunit
MSENQTNETTLNNTLNELLRMKEIQQVVEENKNFSIGVSNPPVDELQQLGAFQAKEHERIQTLVTAGMRDLHEGKVTSQAEAKKRIWKKVNPEFRDLGHKLYDLLTDEQWKEVEPFLNSVEKIIDDLKEDHDSYEEALERISRWGTCHGITSHEMENVAKDVLKKKLI